MDISAKGKRVLFDDRYLMVELKDERRISTPLDWYPELFDASEEIRKNWKFICDQTGIEWPTLDYHLSIESMLMGVPKVGKHAVA
ncbi:hypothetical protein MASR2M78_25600 [Treponema sp.]